MIEMVSKSDYILQHCRFITTYFIQRCIVSKLCVQYVMYVCMYVYITLFLKLLKLNIISDDKMVYLWIYMKGTCCCTRVKCSNAFQSSRNKLFQ